MIIDFKDIEETKIMGFKGGQGELDTRNYVDEKVKNIRKYDINGWTTKKSDDELKVIINKLKDISNIIKQECDKYNFTFIDTSNNFEYVINNISL